jgi:hypothetical protein
VRGTLARSYGQVPAHGASRLLADGERAALIGGYGPELTSSLRFASPRKAWHRLGSNAGLSRPMAWRFRARSTCRGPDLHMINRHGTWYRLSLDDLPAG